MFFFFFFFLIINSLSKISNSLDSNQSIDLPIHTNQNCGTPFENTGMSDLRIDRSVCASLLI